MSKRENIIANRVTALETIKVANSYNYDIDTVTRELKHFRDLNGYPSAVIVNAGETKDADDLHFKNIIAKLTIRVRGIVKAEADIETVANNFLEDIEKAMCNDITCGANANYIAPSDIRMYNAVAMDEIMIFDVDFIANYQYLYGSP